MTQPAENLFRCVVYPAAFESKSKGGILDIGRMIHLTNRGNYIETSVVLQKFAPTNAHVHGYGCRLAARRNAAATGKGNKKTRHIYCGAYHFRTDTVRSLSAVQGLPEVIGASVQHMIEQDEIAHGNLQVRVTDTSDLESTKTAIVDRLWRAFSGPILNVCPEDRYVTAHPGKLLPPANNGPYSDARSYARRGWHMLRYYVYYFRWRLFVIIALGTATKRM